MSSSPDTNTPHHGASSVDPPREAFLVPEEGRASASPEFLHSYDARPQATSSPSTNVEDKSLCESTADWSTLSKMSGNGDHSYNDPMPEASASKEYYLPARKPELYAFLNNPLTKTVEKISKFTDFVVSDRLIGPNRHRSHTSHLFAGLYEGCQRPGAGHVHGLPEEEPHLISIPPPSLPNIETSYHVERKAPMTDEYFEQNSAHWTKREMLNEIFLSGIESMELKRKLWPVILGLYDLNDNAEEAWKRYEQLYYLYKSQWTSFTDDQEKRFNAFRDRKHILQRDVIRCDRKHPFYQKQENLDKIQEILMNYVMHDFDTGYIQGMTDLAAPILYVFDGDVVKSFWCFAQVLEFTKKNFSISKETIFYQLRMLFKLIQMTDPCFAQYLGENNSANCHFAFRWIICLFKREFVKENVEDYSRCLIVWETIWCIHALQKLNASEAGESVCDQRSDSSHRSVDEHLVKHSSNLSLHDLNGEEGIGIALAQSPICTINPEEIEELRRYEAHVKTRTGSTAGSGSDFGSGRRATCVRSDPDGEERFETLAPSAASNPRLEDVELFLLCICLALIRRERDIIMSTKIEDCAILEHFNNLQMSDSFNSILLHATTIWRHLKEDGEEEKLYAEKIDMNSDDNYLSTDGFDLLANDLKPV